MTRGQCHNSTNNECDRDERVMAHPLPIVEVEGQLAEKCDGAQAGVLVLDDL